MPPSVNARKKSAMKTVVVRAIGVMVVSFGIMNILGMIKAYQPTHQVTFSLTQNAIMALGAVIALIMIVRVAVKSSRIADSNN